MGARLLAVGTWFLLCVFSVPAAWSACTITASDGSTQSRSTPEACEEYLRQLRAAVRAAGANFSYSECNCSGGGYSSPDNSEQLRRDERARPKRQAERERKKIEDAEKEAEAQRVFDKNKKEALDLMKVPKGVEGLKGVKLGPQTDFFKLKGVKGEAAGLKVAPGPEQRHQLTGAWQQLHCAAGIVQEVKPKRAKARSDLDEVIFLQDQTNRAMNGWDLEVACAPVGSFPFKPVGNPRSYGAGLTEFMKHTVTEQTRRVEANEKIAALEPKKQAAVAKVAELKAEIKKLEGTSNPRADEREKKRLALEQAEAALAAVKKAEASAVAEKAKADAILAAMQKTNPDDPFGDLTKESEQKGKK